MSQYPSNTSAVLARVEAHTSGTVEFKGTDAERRRWDRMVKSYAASPSAMATVIQSQPRREGQPRERRPQSGRSSARSGDSGDDSGEPEPSQRRRFNLHVPAEKFARWEADRHAAIKQQRAARVPVFDRPADRLLLLLREFGPDAYVPGRQPTSWVARCPGCLERRLFIHEPYHGADVRLWCADACAGADALDALTKDDATDPWRFVDELLSVAHRQQALIASLTRTEEVAA